MTVSIVIPAFNDAEGVTAALEVLNAVDCVSEIIVVDDCSTPALQTPSAGAGKTVTLLRHDTNKGGGGARNTGLAAVTQPFVLFLDSDDLPTPGFGAILNQFLDHGGAFDFAMFRHLDSREIAAGRQSGLAVDERCWDQLPKQPFPQRMDAKQIALMSEVSAYPWNKLYRTAFLRDKAIGCTEIPVHNDIELHWLSFLMAEDVLFTHQTGLTHFVAQGGNRITNRKGADRMRVFEALEPVVARMKEAQVADELELAFWTFFNKLMRWVPNNLQPDLVDDFLSLRQKFMLTHLSPDDFRLLAYRDPGLSSALLGLMQGGQG